MVKLIKSTQNVVLAIGDGANDVSMITAAHVGVGIKGHEGYSAARSSDYAIAQFKFLKILLYKYGVESYRRNTFLVFYNFYKNALLVFPQFYFGIFNRFSALSAYDGILYYLYNILFASLPILIYAVFDYQSSEEDLLSNKNNKY